MNTLKGIRTRDGLAKIDYEILENKPMIVNPNLLDNWYFVDPVNQRGKTSYGGGGYSIDRWTTAKNITIELTDNGIVLSNPSTVSGSGVAFTQQIEGLFPRLKGKMLTLSLLEANNTLTMQTFTMPDELPTSETRLVMEQTSFGHLQFRVATNGNLQFIITPSNAGSSGTVVAVKLEVGDTQTLAHQENGVWVLNEIPNYVEQLAKCQRYFWTTKQPFENYTTPCYTMVARTSSRVAGTISLPVTMRTRPAITVDNAVIVRNAACNNLCFPSAANATLSGNLTNNIYLFDITMTDGTTPFTVGEVYNVLIGNLAGSGDSIAGSALNLSADL